MKIFNKRDERLDGNVENKVFSYFRGKWGFYWVIILVDCYLG